MVEAVGAASRHLVEPGKLARGWDWKPIPGNPCPIAGPHPAALPPPGTWKTEKAPNELVSLVVSIWDARGVNYLKKLYLIGYEERGMLSRKNCSVQKQNLSRYAGSGVCWSGRENHFTFPVSPTGKRFSKQEMTSGSRSNQEWL